MDFVRLDKCEVFPKPALFDGHEIFFRLKFTAFDMAGFLFASPTASSVFCEPSNPAVSSGNASLLAMLVPSLINLSRAGSEAQGRPSSGSMKLCNGSDMEMERRIQEDIGKVEQLRQSSGATKACTGWSTREEGRFDRVKDENCGSGAAICTGGNTREESEYVKSNGESCGSTSCKCRCEESLTKLNGKIDRIVAHCASIEENMAEPLVSMETRLKQLELDKHANFSRDGSSSEGYDGIEKDGCQSRKQRVVLFDRCKSFNCNGFDDESAMEDDIGSDSIDTSCSCSSSDSINDSHEDDVSEDEDVGSEDIEESENVLDERNNLVMVGVSESSVLSCMSCSSESANMMIPHERRPQTTATEDLQTGRAESISAGGSGRQTPEFDRRPAFRRTTGPLG